MVFFWFFFRSPIAAFGHVFCVTLHFVQTGCMTAVGSLHSPFLAPVQQLELTPPPLLSQTFAIDPARQTEMRDINQIGRALLTRA